MKAILLVGLLTFPFFVFSRDEGAIGKSLCCDGAQEEKEFSPITLESKISCLKDHEGKRVLHGPQTFLDAEKKVKFTHVFYHGKLLVPNAKFDFCQQFLQNLPGRQGGEGALNLTVGFADILSPPEEIKVPPVKKVKMNPQEKASPTPGPSATGNAGKDQETCFVVFAEDGQIVKFSPSSREKVSKVESDEYLKEAVRKYYPEMMTNGDFSRLSIFDKRNLVCSHHMEQERPWFDLSFGSYKNGTYQDYDSYQKRNKKGGKVFVGPPGHTDHGSASAPVAAVSSAPSTQVEMELRSAGGPRSAASSRAGGASVCLPGKSYPEKRIIAHLFPEQVKCKEKDGAIFTLFRDQLAKIKSEFDKLNRETPCLGDIWANQRHYEESAVTFLQMQYCHLVETNPSAFTWDMSYKDLKGKVDGMWNETFENELMKKYHTYSFFKGQREKLKELMNSSSEGRDLARKNQ